MMHDEIVERRKWIDNQHFLDLLGATNLIPGPNSSEMSMHIGYVRGGLIGLLVGGMCFSAAFDADGIGAVVGLCRVWNHASCRMAARRHQARDHPR